MRRDRMARWPLTFLIVSAWLASAPWDRGVSAQTASAPPQAPSAASPSINEDEAVEAPAPAERVVRYQRGGAAWWFVAKVWSVVLPAIIVWTGFSARIQRWATRPRRAWFFIVGTYGAIYAAVTFTADWPLSFYTEFARERIYGFSKQEFPGWLGGSLGGLAGSVLGAYFEYWFLYLLIRKSPRRWWFYYSLASVPALVFLVVVAPRVVRPDQGKFERMIDTATEQRVLALAARANIHAQVLIDVNSIDGGRLNAYAVGTGDSKPIVFGQTLVTRLDQAELVGIAGHEVGHHALHHVGRSIFVAWLCSTLGWYVAYRIIPGMVARWSARFGFERISDIASLPLLLIVTGLMSLATGPIELAFSRYQEREADRFALEITHANHSFATGLIKMHEDEADPVDPRPGWLDQAWRETHPSLGERIDFCNTYKPWKTGASGRYGQLIDNPAAQR